MIFWKILNCSFDYLKYGFLYQFLYYVIVDINYYG